MSQSMLMLADAELNDGLVLMVVGMLVVFAGLSVLMFVIAVMNKLSEEKPAELAQAPGPRRTAAPAAPAASPAAVETPGPEATPPGLDPKLVAVLTAAAAAALQRPVRVEGAKVMKRTPDSTWARQGRRQIMASHRPRR